MLGNGNGNADGKPRPGSRQQLQHHLLPNSKNKGNNEGRGANGKDLILKHETFNKLESQKYNPAE